MNVLFMVSWYFPLADKTSEGFHTIQAREIGKHCNVAIYYPYDRAITESVVVNEERGITTYRSRYKLEKKIRNRLDMLRAMKKIIKEFQPDIIHGNVATEAGRFAISYGAIFHIPVIITEHSSADLSGVREFPHYYYAKQVYRKSKYNACVSDKLTSDLKEIFPKYEFHTIYNSIDVPEIVIHQKDYRVEGAFNAALIAGMYMRDIKGIPILLEALKMAADSGLELVIHFGGDGKFRQEFEDIAKNLGVYKNCRFHGRLKREEVYDMVSQMDFLISASRYESFGCSMAEAAVIGTPVLATDSGGAASIVVDDVGILLHEYDAKGIFYGLQRMCKEYDRYGGSKSAQKAREKFDRYSITQKYLEIYKVIVNRA